jgi:hypothetical protein
MVYFQTDDTVPTGLITNLSYFVKYVDENTFEIAETFNGTSVTITGAGIGTLDMYTYVDVAVVFGKYSTFYPP